MSVNLFSVFAKSIERQIKENKQFTQNLKQLSDSSAPSISTVKTVSSTVGSTVSSTIKALDSPLLRQSIKSAASASYTVVNPIIQSAPVQTLDRGIKAIEAITIQNPANKTAHRYIEYRPKQQRDNRRPQIKQYLENPSAGTGIKLHEKSELTKKWEQFKDTNVVFQSLLSIKSNLSQSDNPIIERFREWFAYTESETTQVIKAIQAVDPSFNSEQFMRDAAEYYIPDVLEATLKGDLELLREWCSEQLYAQLSAVLHAKTTLGHIDSSEILDIRKVDLTQMKIIDGIPLLIVDFSTQMNLLVKSKMGEIVSGGEDYIEHSRWRIVFVKEACVDDTLPFNQLTNGWKVMEMVKIDSWAGF